LKNPEKPMKPNYRNRFLAALQCNSVSSVLVAGFIAITIQSAGSATLTWDISPGTVGAGNGTITGGAGTWDTTPTLGNWTVDGGANNVAWVNNPTPDGAIFSGTGGTVTQAGVSVNNITFGSTGYTVTGGTLTMAGVAPKITANSDATISSVLGGTAGFTKDGSGILSIPTKATYTGGTIVNAGVLNLTGGGGSGGTIRETVTVNNGAILRINTGDATGYGTGADRLATININQGSTLNIAVTNNQTLGNAVINLSGGAITGVSGSNLDFFQTTSGLNSLASPVTSTSSGTRLSIRQAAGLTTNVALGTTPSGIDLDINSVIASNGSFTTAPLVKTGSGTLRLNGANTYTGPTSINAGTLIIGAGGSSQTSDITVNNPGTIFRLPTTGKILKSLTLNTGSTLDIAANKTATTTVTNALNTSGTVTVKPLFTDVPGPAEVYNIVTAGSAVSGATYTADTSGFGTSRVTATAAVTGSTLQLTIGTGAANLIWNNNAGTGLWNLNAAANFDNGGSPDVFKSFDGVTFNGTAAGTITLAGALAPGQVTVNSSAGSDYTFSGSGSIANGTLVKSGTSTLTIATSNSHGGTTLNGGVLNATAANATGSGVTTVNGGILNANVAGAAGGGALTLAGGTVNIGNATALGSAGLVLNSGTFDNTTGAALSLANPLTWNGSFTFNGSQNLTTTGGVTLTGNSQVAVDAGTWISNGIISGAFNLTKAGAGTLQMNAANTYSGATTVNGGRLWISNTLRNSSSLSVGSGATLELGATNIFVGGHGIALPNSKVITVNGGTLLMNNLTDFRFGNVTLNNGATWTSNRPLANYDALLANTDAGAATVTVGGTGPSLMNGSGGIHLQGVQNFAVADTTSSPGSDLTVDMVLAGPGTTGGADGGVNKTGAGTMALNGINTYAGATTVNGGTLQIGATGSSTASDFTVNGSTLQIDQTEKTLKSLTVTGGSTLVFAARKLESTRVTNALTTSGAITLKPLFTDSPQTGDLYDMIAANSFVDGGTYTVDMSSRGATRVTATAAADLGQYLTLTIGTGAADLSWTNAAATGVWNHDLDANFDNGGSPDVFKTYDAVTFGDTAAGTVSLSGTLYPGTVTVDSGAGSNYNFAGSGSLGGGTLVKSGDSTLTLSTVNSHGATILNSGTLTVANAGAMGNGSLTITGGIFNNGTGAPLALANAQVWDGVVTFTGPAISFGTAGVTIANPSQVNVGPNGLTIGGPVTGAAGNGFTKKGTGTMTLSGTGVGNISGGMQVDEGTLAVNAGTLAPSATVGTAGTAAILTLDSNQNPNRLGNIATVLVGSNGTMSVNGVNALPNHANSCNFTVEAGGLLAFVSGESPATGVGVTSHHHMGNLTLNGGTVSLPYSGAGGSYNNESVQLNGNVTVGGSVPSTIAFGAGATAATSGMALSGGLATHTFTVADVTGSAAADLTVNAELEDSDAVGGSLIKDGPGTLAFTGTMAHSYTGSTTVTGGTLAADGSVAGPLTVDAGGTIAPGPGTATFGAGPTTISGTYACDVSGANSDKVAVAGTLTLSGATLAVSGTLTEPVYVIASYTGAAPGPFTSVTGLPGGYSVNYAYNNGVTSTNVALVMGTPYTNWETANGIAGAGAEVDSDGDGIANGIEFVIGGDPSGPDSESNALLPVIVMDPTYLNFVYRRRDESVSSNPVVEYGGDLTGWTVAVNGQPGGTPVIITETNDQHGTGTDSVTVRIPRALAAPGTTLFARLKITP
jgi:fibronectin-binding autotransporter adhesin